MQWATQHNNLFMLGHQRWNFGCTRLLARDCTQSMKIAGLRHHLKSAWWRLPTTVHCFARKRLGNLPSKLGRICSLFRGCKCFSSVAVRKAPWQVSVRVTDTWAQARNFLEVFAIVGLAAVRTSLMNCESVGQTRDFQKLVCQNKELRGFSTQKTKPLAWHRIKSFARKA
ncbi:unnamed protein product [Effrenium voratum]|uniref:Uncharacterized protein n=1 Tax=Effrenium voratum TaxID=2562239 RepID=A0AA36HRR7_9DINO|nr:unnamed protein product [Effrenium voratum]